MRKYISFINRKRIRCLFAAISIVFAVTGCGNNQNSKNNGVTGGETEYYYETETTTVKRLTTEESVEESTDNKSIEETIIKADISENTDVNKDTADETTKIQKLPEKTTKNQTNEDNSSIRTTVPTTTAGKVTQAATTQETTVKNDSSMGNAGSDVKSVAKNIVSSIITNGMSEEQKVRALHDYIVKSVRYEISENRDIYTAKGALINKVAVCQGYALGFKELCDEAGIGCEIVYGTGNSEGQNIAHAWNVVRVDGVWYQIDTTWDDPITEGISEEECKKGANLSYAYYLIPDTIMYMDHTANNPPEICTSSKYERTGGYITNETEFSNAVYNEIKKSGKKTVYTITIQCLRENEEEYLQDIFTTLNNGIEKYGKGYANSVSCMYGGNGKYSFLKITFNVVW